MPSDTCKTCSCPQSTHVGHAGAVPIGGCGIIMALEAGYCTVCTIANTPCFAFVAQ
jgi:hypothetical protein